MIPAITLIQPMASAIVWGSKDIENRPRDLPKKMRGVPTIVAVHAGKKWDEDYEYTIRRIDGMRGPIHAVAYEDRLLDEGLVGLMLLSGRTYQRDPVPALRDSVYLVTGPGLGDRDHYEIVGPAALRPHLSWFSGPYGYEILAKVAFEHLIPCRGMQGWWPVPEAAEAAIRAMPSWLVLDAMRGRHARAA